MMAQDMGNSAQRAPAQGTQSSATVRWVELVGAWDGIEDAQSAGQPDAVPVPVPMNS